MKNLRVNLPALAAADAGPLLDLVTKIDGVIAAAVDLPNARLDVVVASHACALLVREEVTSAFYAGWRSFPALDRGLGEA